MPTPSLLTEARDNLALLLSLRKNRKNRRAARKLEAALDEYIAAVHAIILANQDHK